MKLLRTHWFAAFVLVLVSSISFAGLVNVSGSRLTVTEDDGGSGFTPPGSLFYSSSFESPEFSSGGNATGTVMNWEANNPGTIKVSTDLARTGTQSVKFPFQAVCSGCPGILLEWDFNFGSEYHEVTFEYYIHIPSNFVHPDSVTDGSDNDKFFRIHTRVDDGHNQGGYDTCEKLGTSTELSHRSNTQYADLATEWDTCDDGLDFTARGPTGSAAIAVDDFITPADRGQWVKIVWYVKAPTGKGGTGRSYLKLWKNNVLLADMRPDTYDATLSHMFGKGYLFGAKNSCDDSDCPAVTIYLDDIKVWVN